MFKGPWLGLSLWNTALAWYNRLSMEVVTVTIPQVWRVSSVALCGISSGILQTQPYIIITWGVYKLPTAGTKLAKEPLSRHQGL